METWYFFDEVLRYGLFLGAIFQIIAIAAIVVIPPKDKQDADEHEETAEESAKSKSNSKQESKQHPTAPSLRKRTKDKKKR